MLALHQGLSQASLVRDEVMAGSDVTEMFGTAVNRGLNANCAKRWLGLVERSHGVAVGLAWASVSPRGVSVEDSRFRKAAQMCCEAALNGCAGLARTSMPT